MNDIINYAFKLGNKGNVLPRLKDGSIDSSALENLIKTFSKRQNYGVIKTYNKTEAQRLSNQIQSILPNYIVQVNDTSKLNGNIYVAFMNESMHNQLKNGELFTGVF